MPPRARRWSLLAIGSLALLTVIAECRVRVCLFSQVRGVVTLQGTPVPGAEVERTYHWAWNDRRFSEKAKTDAHGRFAFPAARDSSLALRFLPVEPVIGQEITIRHAGQKHTAWLYTKHDYKEWSELQRALLMKCELSLKQDLPGRGYSGLAELSSDL